MPGGVSKITTFSHQVYDIAAPTAASTFTLSSKTAIGGQGILGRFILKYSMLGPFRNRRLTLFNVYGSLPGPTTTSTFTLSSKTARGGRGMLARFKLKQAMQRTVFDTALVVDGIASAAAVGTPLVLATQPLFPTGVASAAAPGTPSVMGSLSPSGVASGAAVGTPIVAISSILLPSGVASAEAVGTPVVAQEQFIQAPPGVASKAQPGVPFVSGGVLMPSGVESGEAVGTPGVFPVQTLEPGGVPSEEAVGLPIVRLIQTVSPGGVATAEACGTPNVTGAEQRVIFAGNPIVAPSVGTPSVHGGSQLTTIWIAGVDVTWYLRVQTASVASQTIGRWNAGFELRSKGDDLSWLDVGQTVLIQEFSQKVFAGCLQTLFITGIEGHPGDNFIKCTAVDKSGVFDRRVCRDSFFAATEDGADVIRRLVANSLTNEGITVANVPPSLGALGADLNFNLPYCNTAMDQICDLIACVWWVDINSDLHVSPLLDLPQCEHEITDTSANYRKLTIERSLLDYRNAQIVVSDRTVLPGGGGGAPSTTETYTLTPNGQQEAFDVGLSFGYILLKLPIQGILSLTVNGSPRSVFNFMNDSAPPYASEDCWYFYVGSSIVVPGFLPSVGQTIAITYIPQIASASVTQVEVLEPSGPALGTCGSGRYEAVQQVRDVTKSEDLQTIGQAKLTRQNGIPLIARWEADEHGYAPGQKIRLDRPDLDPHAANVELMITNVSGVSQFVELRYRGVPLACSFRWQIEARSNHDPGNTVKWYERLVRATAFGQPVLRTEKATFVLSPDGATIANGVPLGNPFPVENTGRLTRLTIQTGDESVDEDLIVTIRDETRNFDIGSITLPAAFAANTQLVFDFPTATPQYVFKGDNLRASAVHLVTGANPTPAANISVTAAWVY